jgi:hypothetical protein
LPAPRRAWPISIRRLSGARLRCPACKASQQVLFDIAAFFWSEIGACAKRLLREIHLLARAYCWREADILAMSAWRRECYLAMVQG